MNRGPSGEEWLAQVNAIVKLYRVGNGTYAGRAYYGPMPLEAALAELKKLGLGEGHALRWLGKRAPQLTG